MVQALCAAGDLMGGGRGWIRVLWNAELVHAIGAAGNKEKGEAGKWGESGGGQEGGFSIWVRGLGGGDIRLE
jgi:hypothetical protein